MSEELKACPFCGKPAQFRSMSFGDDLVRVYCSVCAISTDYYPNNDYSSAANKWQSRPIEDALREELREVTAAGQRDGALALTYYQQLKDTQLIVKELEAKLQKSRVSHSTMFENSVAKVVYDRVKAEGIKLAEVVSIQASRINELERQLFFLGKDLGNNTEMTDGIKQLTLDDLKQKARLISVAHGWWETDRNDGEIIALMHSELSEALEALRHGNPPSEHIPEFSGVEEEMADVIIRILDYSAARGLRIYEAIQAKMTYNESRPIRHGKLF